MIIDCHCHAGAGDGLTGPWDTRATLGNYTRWAKGSGITHTVIFPAFHSNYHAANWAVARTVAESGGRYFGFAFVHAVRDQSRVYSMVSELVNRAGFCGIKVHRYDARITREICEAARRLRIPVLYDVMGEVSACELLATEYGDVNFIIPHLSSFGDNWKAQRAFLDPLARHANIYTDTSAVQRFELLEEAIARAGAHKVLFGSDGPWLHPGLELAKVRALKLSRANEALVLGGNWLRLTADARQQGVTGSRKHENTKISADRFAFAR